MTELIFNPQLVAFGFVLLALGTPACGAIVLAANKKHRERLQEHPIFYLLAASGPVIAVLWLLFNFIEDLFGLDSILALLLNLTVFALAGLGLGAALKYGSRPPLKKGGGEEVSEKSPPEPDGKSEAGEDSDGEKEEDSKKGGRGGKSSSK